VQTIPRSLLGKALKKELRNMPPPQIPAVVPPTSNGNGNGNGHANGNGHKIEAIKERS
jgi:hypothetical protein